MENTNVLDLVTGGIAILILIGGMLMPPLFLLQKRKEPPGIRLGIGTRSRCLTGKLSQSQNWKEANTQAIASRILWVLLVDCCLVCPCSTQWKYGGLVLPIRTLLIYVLATFTLLLGYNRYSGLRCDASPAEVAIDSVEEMGLGLLIAAFVLWLLGQITFDMTVNEILGKIIIEAMTVRLASPSVPPS